MKKKRILYLVILVICLVLTSSLVYSLDWHTQKSIAKEIANKQDYDGSLRFAYYVTKPIIKTELILENNFYYAYYRGNSNYNIITFYKESELLTKHQFKCLVLHELGHYNDYKFNHHTGTLSEDIADEYMINQDNSCEGWK